VVLSFLYDLFVKAGIDRVNILLVLPLGRKAEAFAETLIMDDLAFAQNRMTY
jgi:hypothetical protein